MTYSISLYNIMINIIISYICIIIIFIIIFIICLLDDSLFYLTTEYHLSYLLYDTSLTPSLDLKVIEVPTQWSALLTYH